MSSLFAASLKARSWPILAYRIATPPDLNTDEATEWNNGARANALAVTTSNLADGRDCRTATLAKPSSAAAMLRKLARLRRPSSSVKFADDAEARIKPGN